VAHAGTSDCVVHDVASFRKARADRNEPPFTIRLARGAATASVARAAAIAGPPRPGLCVRRTCARALPHAGRPYWLAYAIWKRAPPRGTRAAPVAHVTRRYAHSSWRRLVLGAPRVLPLCALIACDRTIIVEAAGGSPSTSGTAYMESSTTGWQGTTSKTTVVGATSGTSVIACTSSSTVGSVSSSSVGSVSSSTVTAVSSGSLGCGASWASLTDPTCSAGAACNGTTLSMNCDRVTSVPDDLLECTCEIDGNIVGNCSEAAFNQTCSATLVHDIQGGPMLSSTCCQQFFVAAGG